MTPHARLLRASARLVEKSALNNADELPHARYFLSMNEQIVRDARARGLIVPFSGLHRLLTCARCSGDFVSIGRDHYGCGSHYRERTCSNGKTVQRRSMEERIREVLVGTVTTIDRYPAALMGDEQLNRRDQRRQLEVDRRQLEKVDVRVANLMAAIEDGLYTSSIKLRVQQLEDQAERLRAKYAST